MSKIFIGNLPGSVREREVEDLFYKYGKIRFIDVKVSHRGPAFAFIEFADSRDAEAAVRGRDGYTPEFARPGQRLRVEIARGGSGNARENFRPPRSSGHRILVKGLPRSCSWQDLKDHIRTAVRPNHTDVRTDNDGNVVGVVEFDTYEDMKLAIRKLDDTEIRNPRYEPGHYVRLIEDSGGRGRDDDRRRSRSRSRSRSRGRSASRSASPADRDRDRRDRDDRGRRPAGEEDEPERRPRSRSLSRSRSRSRSR